MSDSGKRLPRRPGTVTNPGSKTALAFDHENRQRTLLDMIGQAITVRPQLLRPAASRPPENHSVTPNQIPQKGWPRGQANRAAGITAHRADFSLKPEQTNQTKPTVRPGKFRVARLSPLLQSHNNSLQSPYNVPGHKSVNSLTFIQQKSIHHEKNSLHNLDCMLASIKQRQRVARRYRLCPRSERRRHCHFRQPKRPRPLLGRLRMARTGLLEKTPWATR